jgi:serine/threonine protein kinase
MIAFEPESGRLFLEFIDAPTLKDLVTDQTYATNPERIHIILKHLAEVVADLHEGVLCSHPVIHNDLKPCNLMVLPGDEVSLIDFSHSYVPNHNPSFVTERDRDPIGTAKYMAPEKWDCNYSLGNQSDVFAFGVLGYVAATGQYPFEGTPAQLEEIIKNTQPVYPLKLNVPISRNLASIIMDCLAKDPKGRPTMRHVADSLRLSQQVSRPSYNFE